MSKKMFLLFALIFSMLGNVSAEENLEAAEFEETEEVAPGNKKEEAAEIEEIDAVEKVKEADVDKKITIKDGAAEDVAEDIAEGKEEAKEEVALATKNAKDEVAEPVVEDNKAGSSWFSWMWPFSSSTKEEAVGEDGEDGEVADVVEVIVDDEGNKKVEEVVVVEDAKGDVVVEDVEVVEDADGEVVAVEEEVVENEPVEPAVEVAVETDKCGAGGSCFVRNVLLYIPNVLLNLTDIISCGVAVGAEAGVEFRVTRFFQFGGQYGEAAFIEKAYKRVYGGGIDNGYNFQLAALASEVRYVDDTFGGVKPYIDDVHEALINSPKDLIYENGTRDFWAIGVEAGWLVNVRFDLHPVEFADFLASLIALDITGDNLK